MDGHRQFLIYSNLLFQTKVNSEFKKNQIYQEGVTDLSDLSDLPDLHYFVIRSNTFIFLFPDMSYVSLCQIENVCIETKCLNILYPDMISNNMQ